MWCSYAPPLNSSCQARDGSSFGAQWSRSKVIIAMALRQSSAPTIMPTQLVCGAIRKAQKFEERDGRYMCTSCKLWKDSTQFTADSKSRHGIRSTCRECHYRQTDSYRRSFVGVLQVRRLSAKQRAESESVPYSLHGHESKDGLLQKMWRDQNGRGYYTHLPLHITVNGEWVVSIERFKKELGYTVENICLEVFEANTQVQWSKDFANSIWGPLSECSNPADRSESLG